MKVSVLIEKTDTQGKPINAEGYEAKADAVICVFMRGDGDTINTTIHMGGIASPGMMAVAIGKLIGMSIKEFVHQPWQKEASLRTIMHLAEKYETGSTNAET